MIDELEAIFRRESGRCVASLIRIFGDIDLAEDAVAEAFAIAVEKWPRSGIPSNPGGWIMTTARNRVIDVLRRESVARHRQRDAQRLRTDDTTTHDGPDPAVLSAHDDCVDVVTDNQLRLMFLCAHPCLSIDAQVALTLRLLGGLTTNEIAKAFVVPESTLAQRIVRAKRRLLDNCASFCIPDAAEFPERLQAVLATIYLIYTEGHTATSGPELARVDLSHEAIRLGRTLTTLVPGEAEAVGLLALMVLSESRRLARVDPDGAMVRLADQDRSRWDRRMIDEGHELVRTCLRLDAPGPFQIQAAIAAVHCLAPTAEATDWRVIVSLYDDLYARRPNAVVTLNRAVAVGELLGPSTGLAALAQVDTESLEHYQPYHAAHADLLSRAGRLAEARVAYDRAIELTTNDVERDFLIRQRARCHGGRPPTFLED